jgi:hypothetical protein
MPSASTARQTQPTPGVPDLLVLSAGASGTSTLIAHNEAGDSAESSQVTITLG